MQKFTVILKNDSSFTIVASSFKLKSNPFTFAFYDSEGKELLTYLPESSILAIIPFEAI